MTWTQAKNTRRPALNAGILCSATHTHCPNGHCPNGNCPKAPSPNHQWSQHPCREAENPNRYPPASSQPQLTSLRFDGAFCPCVLPVRFNFTLHSRNSMTLRLRTPTTESTCHKTDDYRFGHFPRLLPQASTPGEDIWVNLHHSD